MSEAIPDKNIFMVCRQLDRSALSEPPAGFHFRLCRRDELQVWKDIQSQGGGATGSYLDGYYAKWYAPQGDLFFRRCAFVCDGHDVPVGSAFLWKQYGRYTTLHWLKVLSDYEGRGLGRALISHLLRGLPAEDYPVYLHTQPSSYRAIKLYTDFGFALLSAPAVIDGRPNEVQEALPILRRYMRAGDYERLRLTVPEAE